MPVKSPRYDAVDQVKLAQRFESRTYEYSSKTVADWSTRSKMEADWLGSVWVRRTLESQGTHKTLISFNTDVRKKINYYYTY